MIDLTERKKAEEEFRESEGRYRVVAEQAAAGIVLFDVNSKRVSEANVACQNLLGYTPEAILRLTLHDLGPYSPGSFPRIRLTCAELRGSANRRVAYVLRNAWKAIESL